MYQLALMHAFPLALFILLQREMCLKMFERTIMHTLLPKGTLNYNVLFVQLFSIHCWLSTDTYTSACSLSSQSSRSTNYCILCSEMNTVLSKNTEGMKILVSAASR